MTATSLCGSRPTSLAGTLLLSASVTSRLSAFSTTWLLVKIRPLSSTTNPEPVPRSGTIRKKKSWFKTVLEMWTTPGPAAR